MSMLFIPRTMETVQPELDHNVVRAHLIATALKMQPIKSQCHRY